MDYEIVRKGIEKAILKNPADVSAYEDMFSLFKDYDGVNHSKAHERNRDFQTAIRNGLNKTLGEGDFDVADKFSNLLFRSLVFDAPFYFDAYLQAVEITIIYELQSKNNLLNGELSKTKEKLADSEEKNKTLQDSVSEADAVKTKLDRTLQVVNYQTVSMKEYEEKIKELTSELDELKSADKKKEENEEPVKISSETEKEAKKEVVPEEPGTLADVAARINNIFASAQKTADDYIQLVNKKFADRETVIAEARTKSDEIISNANKEADILKAQADFEINQKWAVFNSKVDSVLKAHEELKDLLKR